MSAPTECDHDAHHSIWMTRASATSRPSAKMSWLAAVGVNLERVTCGEGAQEGKWAEGTRGEGTRERGKNLTKTGVTNTM